MMQSYEERFTAKGFAVLKHCVLEKAPANPRERIDALAKAHGIAAEQVVKALALQIGPAGGDAGGTGGAAPSGARLLLAPAGERIDFKILSHVLGCEAGYFPQEDVERVFGSPMQALSPLGLPTAPFPASQAGGVLADGRIFEQDQVVIPSGDPLVELLISADDLRAFLGESVRIIDWESAKQFRSGVIQPRTLKGFRDYLPEEMLPRQGMIAAIAQVFERYGFAPLQTPALEYSDILLGKLGGDAEKLLFRFRDNGGRDVCLRYDLTVPLARVAAQYPELPKPFKRYQIAPVWRAENPGRGRFREFFQCDCDIVGSPSLIYDAECIALDFAVMRALEVNAEVRFNNRKVLAALGRSLNVSDERQMMAIFRTIDKLPSQGKERVRELLVTEAACNGAQIEQILSFVEIEGSNAEMLVRLADLLGPLAAEAVDELRRVKEYVSAMCVITTNLKLDFSIARGLDYYTGTVYETFLTDLPGFGSVMSGGRYDGLIERYLGRPMPAVGISVGIDRLFAGLMELGRVTKSSVTSQVMVVPMDAACVMRALSVLGHLRAAGIAAEMALENEQKPKLDKQLSLAGKKGIPFAAILGSNEVAKGTVMLKNLETRQQEELALENAIAKLAGGR